jgi:hypothetical protein
MNPYLAKLKSRDHEKPHPQAPSKPSKHSFEGFEGNRGRALSETGRLEKAVEDTPFGRFARVFELLESHCPDLVPVDRWQKCVEDGHRFLAQWGGHAEASGWTARDLFGLASVPDNSCASYRRLSRYDATGLIWLLEGREIIGLTEDTATIRSQGGSVTVYRKHDKPAHGPLGDSLDDLR